MKFVVVVGNPPYDSLRALHQQFFNKAFGVLNLNGTAVFIQPANPYLNKKDTRRKGHEVAMQEIIKKHAVSVEFKNEDVFQGAMPGSKLAITVASTKETNGILEVTYMDGSKCESDLEGINQLMLPSDVYHSLRAKVDDLCQKNGSFQDRIRERAATCAKLPKVRGHAGMDDFFTFIPAKTERAHYSYGQHDFGIPLESPYHLENFYDYCETNFARMSLALVKMDINLTGGELKHVPLVDFSRTYTDQELYDMAGFTQEEIQVIENTLPDYYNRKS